MTIPPRILDTLIKALKETKERFIDDIPTVFIADWRREELDRMDAALAWLDTPTVPQPEPDWSQAPEWAQWWAVDANNSAYWYEIKPTLLINCWVAITVEH